VDFGTRLDLAPYMSDRRGDAQPYELFGVLVHAGHTVHSGHYYCFVRAANGLWHQCDDHQVKQARGRPAAAHPAARLAMLPVVSPLLRARAAARGVLTLCRRTAGEPGAMAGARLGKRARLDKSAAPRSSCGALLAAQVCERIVLAQKAYILFYMRAAPRPGGALPPLQTRPGASPRAAAAPGSADAAARRVPSSAPAPAPSPARARDAVAGSAARPGVRPLDAPAPLVAGSPRSGAGLAPGAAAAPGGAAAGGRARSGGAGAAAEPLAVEGAAAAGAGAAAKRAAGAGADAPGAAQPRKRRCVLAGMQATPTRDAGAAAQVTARHPPRTVHQAYVRWCAGCRHPLGARGSQVRPCFAANR